MHFCGLSTETEDCFRFIVGKNTNKRGIGSSASKIRMQFFEVFPSSSM